MGIKVIKSALDAHLVEVVKAVGSPVIDRGY